MIRRAEAAVSHEDAASLNLPEKLEFAGDPEEAWKYWDWLEAIEWKWDLKTVMQQDEVLMGDIATLAGAYNTIYRLAREKEK